MQVQADERNDGTATRGRGEEYEPLVVADEVE